MSVLKIADKASEAVVKKTPRVVSSLKKIKFFLIGLPILGAILGYVTEQGVPEKQVVFATFEVGSILPPGATEPLDIAEEGPMKSRMRESSKKIAENYPGGLLLSTTLDMPVVKVTATAQGLDTAAAFLQEVMDAEVAFQNTRFDEFTDIFEERKKLLTDLAAEKTEQINQLTEAINGVAKTGPSAGQWFALQESLMRASDKRSGFKKELNAMKYQQRNDLLIGKSEVTRAPKLFVSSAVLRPVMFSLIGFGIGVLLTFILIFFTVTRALSGSEPEEKNG